MSQPARLLPPEHEASPLRRWGTIADLGVPWLTEPPPPRDWLLRRDGKGALPQGVVGLLVAPGGRGKTMLLGQLVIALATRRRWLDTFEAPPVRRVVLALAEETEDEIRRRLYYAAKALGLTAHERQQAERLIVPLGLAGELVGLVSNDGKSVAPTALHGELMGRLGEEEHSLVILDPLSRWAPDVESGNAAATAAVQALEALTTAPGNPTVLVAHHTPKWSRREGSPTDSTAARGVTGLVDAVRWCAVLGGATEHDISLAVTKSNYGPKGAPLALVRDDSGILRPPTAEELSAAGAVLMGADQAREAERRAAVLALVGDQPGIGVKAIKAGVSGRNVDVGATVKALEADGLIVDLGAAPRTAYHLASTAEEGVE